MNKKKDIREAVALEYNPRQGVPVVTAAGKGKTAERIIETAMQNAVPVHEDPGLAHVLNTLAIGDQIPPELYNVVAQILIYVAQTEREQIRQRQAEGIKAAKARGVKFGRKPMERPDIFREVLEAWECREISAREAGRRLGVSCKTFQSWAGE